MAKDIQTKAQLDAAFQNGWTLSPMKIEDYWLLQEGKPGHGGKALTVTNRAVQSFLKDHSVRRVGGPYEWHYIRAGSEG